MWIIYVGSNVGFGLGKSLMKKRMKRAGRACVVALTGVVLAGCGADDDDKKNDPEKSHSQSDVSQSNSSNSKPQSIFEEPDAELVEIDAEPAGGAHTNTKEPESLRPPTKYTHAWANFCKKRPENQACQLENFAENAKSFTSIMGLQKEARSSENRNLVRYDKFVSGEYITIRRSGDFPDNTYCEQLDKVISDHKDELVRVAHSGWESYLLIDYYFLTYLDVEKLSKVIQTNFMHSPISWNPIPENEIVEHEYALTHPVSTYLRSGTKQLNQYSSSISRPEKKDDAQKTYDIFSYYDVPNTSYRIYNLKPTNLDESDFQNTEFNSYKLFELYSKYERSVITYDNSVVQAELPVIRVADFVDENGFYFLGHVTNSGVNAPDLLSTVDLYFLDPELKPTDSRVISYEGSAWRVAGPVVPRPHCTIEFIFNPTP